MNNDVVVTGIGLVTPLGIGKQKTWNNLLRGESAVKHYDTKQDFLYAYIKDLDVPTQARLLSIAFLACADAIKDSALDIAFINRKRFGCTVSVSKPNLDASFSNQIKFSDVFMQSTIGRQLSAVFKIEGPKQNISAACATGTDSVILASEWIKQGICDVAIAGACESSFHPLYVSSFKNMGVLAKNRVCPFDRKREGFALSEGAGILVLERKDHAMLRCAKIYGHISGWAMSNDTSHPIAFNSEGEVIAKSIVKTLQKAGTQDIDYINAHGTATRLNDLVETMAIKKAFGSKSQNISISSTKASTGHMLGATGAVEIGFCLLCINNNVVPATLNLNDPDTECDLDYTPNHAKSRNVNKALSLSFGFGGQIGSILVQR